MVQRDEIVHYLNNLLNIKEFEDYCVNGMQVEGKENVEKIILGVSVSERLFQLAVEKHADMIIVHHGMFWKSDPSPYVLTGISRTRLALLLKNDINLLAYHLPLDVHPEIGNNARIMNKLHIEPLQPVDVGFLGQLKVPLNREKFIALVDQQLQTRSQVFAFGQLNVQKVLVISGSSSPSYRLAIETGADTFIGGDIRENIVRELEEAGLNFIHAGHYNTEKFGIQALGEKLQQEFKLTCEFIDIPNPV